MAYLDDPELTFAELPLHVGSIGGSDEMGAQNLLPEFMILVVPECCLSGY
jgi:hypothetical protein